MYALTSSLTSNWNPARPETLLEELLPDRKAVPPPVWLRMPGPAIGEKL